MNNKRLEYLEKMIKLLDIANRGYDSTNALDLLDDYDHKSFKKIKGTTSNKRISYEECMDIIHQLRFNEESDIFALERENGLKSILGNIYQSFDGRDVYPTLEEKAANFLYMIVKKS